MSETRSETRSEITTPIMIIMIIAVFVLLGNFGAMVYNDASSAKKGSYFFSIFDYPDNKSIIVLDKKKNINIFINNKKKDLLASIPKDDIKLIYYSEEKVFCIQTIISLKIIKKNGKIISFKTTDNKNIKLILQSLDFNVVCIQEE